MTSKPAQALGIWDVAVIGAGLIGASAASQISQHCKVVLIEQESHPGYHSSGRSAALLIPTYGGPGARALTASSMKFLSDPPKGFCDFPLVTPRGALFVANADQLSLLERWSPGGDESDSRRLTSAEALQYVPILKEERIAAALWMPEVRDIDASALLQGYLRALRASDGALLLNSTAIKITRTADLWAVETTTGVVRAKILVNAAGAWADQIAELAGVARRGLVPKRRTMAVVKAPEGIDVRGWPLVCDAGETFYFKPDAGRLVVSPADCSQVIPQDIQPDDWDVAVAVDRLEAATSLRVRRVEHQWAGLRTFSPDEEPIIGFDPGARDFLWAAGFGGFGVQASSAAGRCCAALVAHDSLPVDLGAHGVDLGTGFISGS